MAAIINTLADLITIILGVIALWNIIWHRKKISAFVKLLSSTILNERVKRIKETLRSLQSINFNDKENRQEIYALLGAVVGQVKQFADHDPKFKELYVEIHEYLNRTKALNEPAKRRIVSELDALLDAKTTEAALTILEQNNGS